MTQIAQNRRQFCRGISAGALVGFTCRPGVSFAGGDGGNDPSRASRPKAPPALKQQYSQREFLRLGDREISHIWGYYGRTKKNGPKIVVSGFSTSMTFYLVDLIYYDKHAARRLIRDLSKLDKPAERKARLAAEVKRINDRIAKLKAAQERARKSKFKSAEREAEGRILDAQRYLKSLKVWVKYPHEGTR